MGTASFTQRLHSVSKGIKSNPDSCLKIFNELFNEYSSKKDTAAMAATLAYIGDIYDTKQDPETAIKKYITAKGLIRKTSNKEWNLWISEHLSMLFSNNQNYIQAYSLLQESKKYFNGVLNDTLYAEWCFSMGALYARDYYKRLDSAIYFLHKSGDLFSKYKKWTEVGACYNMMGEVADLQKDYKNSLIYHQKAVEYHSLANDIQGVITATKNLGDLYYYIGQNDKSLEHYLKAYEMGRDSGASYENLAIYSTDVAYMYGLLKNKKKLNEFYNISLDYANKDKQAYVYEYIYKWYSGIYEIIGDYPLALKIHKLYVQAKDSAMKQSGIDELAKLETDLNHKYQLEVQEKEKQMIAEREKDQKKLRNVFIAGFLIALLLLFYVFKSYKEKKKANAIIQQQKEEVELKNKEITDSINYAKRIQEAILPGDKQLKETLQEHFVLFIPKDIVSGDLYWVKQVGTKSLFAAIDCTGHGVPGAFMSILAKNGIDKSVSELKKIAPDQILKTLDEYIHESLKKGIHGSSINDGMDMSLCVLDREKNQLLFSGAMNPLCVVHNKECIFIKGDRNPIGGALDATEKTFNTHTLELQKGDMVYLFSDGYHDQFGGTDGKKLKLKNLKDFLVHIAELPVNEQKSRLHEHIRSWKGNHEQVDDILVIGVRC